VVRPRRISDFKPRLTNLAQTSHYQVQFGGLPTLLRKHLNVRGVDYRFLTETSGLLCNKASLPGSSLGTQEIVGNFMGVTENMAHSRIFTPIQLEFYVDNEYKTMKFLEHWIEFIANGSGETQSQAGYYHRMEYPNDYKTYQTKIIKFDRDYQHELQYTFYGLFPYNLVSTPVTYKSSDILKVTCSFYYDRYVCGKFDSYSVHRGTSNNKEGTANNDSGLPGRLEDPTTPLGRATQAAIGPYESGRDILGDSLSDTFVGEARRNRL
jgi:hypothetical protein